MVMRALLELEVEQGPAWFAVAVIHDRVSAIAQREHPVVIEQMEGAKAWREEIERQARDGDKDAALILSLGASIARFRPRAGRKRERRERNIDDVVNLSRAITALERRGLVERSRASRQGQSYVGLTDAGRAISV
ncbi:MAG: hypothetical protein NXI12_14450 [Alphaproteobacteria bacterium]|nr:hypothetical protein [Alphaproteobacteria bacterium]